MKLVARKSRRKTSEKMFIIQRKKINDYYVYMLFTLTTLVILAFKTNPVQFSLLGIKRHD